MQKALKEFFKRSGMSQYQLAKQMRIDRSTVTRWMKGQRKPARTQLAVLSKITGIKVEDLL
jgi:transcriptional regulator with XRE-family HTH domain